MGVAGAVPCHLDAVSPSVASRLHAALWLCLLLALRCLPTHCTMTVEATPR